MANERRGEIEMMMTGSEKRNDLKSGGHLATTRGSNDRGGSGNSDRGGDRGGIMTADSKRYGRDWSQSRSPRDATPNRRPWNDGPRSSRDYGSSKKPWNNDRRSSPNDYNRRPG